MAIAKMTKVIVVSHRSEASELLEALQREGICQILNAEQAMVSKDWPDLCCANGQEKKIREQLSRLERSIKFLNNYGEIEKGLTSIFAPRVAIEAQRYKHVVSDEGLLDIIAQAEQTQTAIEKLRTKAESLNDKIRMLSPWQQMQTATEELGELETATSLPGLLPVQYIGQIGDLEKMGAVVQQVGQTDNKCACIIICLNDNLTDVQKQLRGIDFEPVNFEQMEGTPAEIIKEAQGKLTEIQTQSQKQQKKAVELSKNLLELSILADHCSNLLEREQTEGTSPATEQTVIFEGWVKSRDYKSLEKLVSKFGASSVNKMKIAKDEEVPVEIDNGPAVRPFETVTRLYGMPAPTDVDPTVFFAPFFAIFFGLCMTDAAYGLVMIAFMWWLIKKIKGDKKFVWMMVFCSVTTVVAGALTGGWFGDAIQSFFGQESALNKLRTSLMWFDPMEKPMYFFTISLALGYFQIIFGILISFVHKLRRKDYSSAIFDHLSWLIWLNCLAVFGLAKGGILPDSLGKIFGLIALVPAVTILLFSEREGNWGARIGMGFYNVFSTVFFVGDVLSYIRLMALGMVTGGFGMATNEICKSVMTWEVGFLGQLPGYIAGAIIFVVMHAFNIANSALSSFVHTMRLQFVELFTKFIIGGGKDFKPLCKQYTRISIEE